MKKTREKIKGKNNRFMGYIYILMFFVKNARPRLSDQRQKQTNNRLLMSLPYLPRLPHTLPSAASRPRLSKKPDGLQSPSPWCGTARRSPWAGSNLLFLLSLPQSPWRGRVGVGLRALLTHRERSRMAEERERERGKRWGGGRE